MPKSKRAALARKRANCTGIGSLSPSSSRSFRRSSIEVSWPTIWLMGSPTKRNTTKAMRATVTMTMAASKSRRMANASIGRGYPTAHRAADFPQPVRSRLFHLRPVEQDLVVGALHDLNFLRHAPDQRLLVQRDDPGLVVADAECLRNHVVALLGIGLHQDLLVERVDLGIAISAEIEGSTFAVGVATTDDVLDHIPAVERARRPAEQAKGAVVFARGEDFLEVLGLRLGVELHLDLDAREHLRDGLTDRLVVDVAVVGAVHLHLEAVRIARFPHQLLGGGHVVGPALELAGTGKEERRDQERRVYR